MTRTRPWLAALALALPALAAAGDPPPPRRSPPAPKVLRLEELKVEGKIRKPQAMFLLPRANLNPGQLDRAEPLVPKVTKAIEREPF
jgi:hypothetical protein